MYDSELEKLTPLFHSEQDKRIMDSRSVSKLSSILSNYTDETTPDSQKLPDGRYLTNVWCHPKGERERIVEIKDGVVYVPLMEPETGTMPFSQSAFFGPESNIVGRKLD